ncbi:MAG: M13-type metalloendopeptidase [Pirellulales bacterium]
MRNSWISWVGTAAAVVIGGVAVQPAWAQSVGSGVDKANISATIKPGDDFYEYVNDGWLKKTEIPGDRSNYGAFSILEDVTLAQVRELIETAAATKDAPAGSDTQKVGDFFRGYMDLARRNELGTKPIAGILSQVAAVKSPAEVLPLAAKLSRQGVGGVIGAYVEPDARRSEQYAVYVTQSGISLPDRDYYLEDDARYKQAQAALKSYITDMLKAIDYPDAAAYSEKIFALETELAKVQWTNVENRDPVRTYNKLGHTEIASRLSQLNWPEFIKEAGFEKEESAIVRQVSFLEGVDKLTKEIPLDTWKAYYAFQTVDAYAPMLSESLEKLHFAFHQTAISGVAEQKPMWRRGVEATNHIMGEIVGRLYVEKHFPAEAKKRMQVLVENLKKACSDRIDQLEWMSPATKKQAHDKLSKFSTKIGYPDKWKDYTKLEIKPNDLVGNNVRYAQYETDRELAKLGGPIDRNEWHMTPQTINAYYNPLLNEIVFPAAILQPPFFNMQADDAANYGGIGAVIGHELSHGFDDKGSQYDGNGNLRNWWSEEDRSEFERRAGELVGQYSSFKPFEDMSVNGELTLGENIGDLGGLNFAYSAYRKSLGGKEAPVIEGLTGDQRFFLGWGQVWRRLYREPELRRRLLTDPHSPSRYRVNGIVANMEAFYAAFDIKPGDKLYIAPEKRVKIW